MDNATQYQYELLDIAKLLLRKQGITEGHWTIGVNFGIAATNAGPGAEAVRPSMIVSVDKMIISRADGPGPLTLDAAIVAKQ